MFGKSFGLILAVASGLFLAILVADAASSGEDGKKVDPQDLRQNIEKIAAAIKADKPADARKLAEEVAKAVGPKHEQVATLLWNRIRYNPAKQEVFKSASFGFGPDPDQPIRNTVRDVNNSIERKLDNLQYGPNKLTQARLDKEAADLEEMAYRIAAVAEVAGFQAPEKDRVTKSGQKLKRADWLKWSGELRKSAPELAQAAKSKNLLNSLAAVKKIDNTCCSCHSHFRCVDE